MPYATPEDLKKPAWGLPERALKNATDEELTQAIDAASAEIDTYLRSQYILPLQDAAALLVLGMKCCHMAAWYVLCGRGFDPTKGGDEAVRMRHTDALKWLQRVADGSAHLISPPAGGGPDSGDDYGAIVDSERGRGW